MELKSSNTILLVASTVATLEQAISLVMVNAKSNLPLRWLLLWVVSQQLQQGVHGNLFPGRTTTNPFANFQLESSLSNEDGGDGIISGSTAFLTEIPSCSEWVPPSSTNPPTETTLRPSQKNRAPPSIDLSIHPSESTTTTTILPLDPPAAFTNSASSMPSSSNPSPSPTTDCHDLANYQSPINGFTCSAHANTDCLAWRFLGLNIMALEELVESCPITCKIQCGTFRKFATSLAFRLAKVPGFLDKDKKARLEKISVEYLQEFVQGQLDLSDTALVEFENAILTFQNLIENSGNVRHRLRQPSTNQIPIDPVLPNKEALEIAISIQGFTIGVDTKNLEKLLLDGIISSGYRSALRRSDDFFHSVEITFQNQTVQRSPNDQIDDDVSESSRATVFVSFMVPIVIVGFILASVAYHQYHHSGAWMSRRSLQRQLDGDVAVLSSEQRASHDNSQDKIQSSTSGCPEESVASDDETAIAGTGRRGGRNSFRGLFASLSLSRSRTSTEPGSQDENEVPDQCFTQSKIPVMGGPVASKMHYGFGDSDVDDLQRKAFPPMIVIDNIDDRDNLEAVPSSTDDEIESHSRTIPRCKDNDRALDQFASEFREAIKTQSTNSRSLVFPDAFESFFETIAPNESSVADSKPTFHSRSSLDMLFGSESSDEDDDEGVDGGSIASTPVKSAQFLSNRPLRRTSSFNTIDHIGRRVLSANDQGNKVDTSMQFNVCDAPRTAVSATPPPTNMLPMSPSTPPEVIEKGRLRGLPPIRRFHTPERWQRELRPQQYSHSPRGNQQQKRNRKALPMISFSPMPKTSVEFSGGSKHPTLPRMGSSCSINSTSGHHRHNSSSTSSSHHRMASSSSISADGFRISSGEQTNKNIPAKDPDFVRVEFVAPRQGQLGLVLGEKSSCSGTHVIAVKDYSPLFGMIMKGDRMLEIDGKNVAHATLTEITKLMKASAKPFPFVYPRAAMNGGTIVINPHHNLRIAVLRRPSPAVIVADTDHKRHDSLGSGSGGSLIGSTIID